MLMLLDLTDFWFISREEKMCDAKKIGCLYTEHVWLNCCCGIPGFISGNLLKSSKNKNTSELYPSSVLECTLCILLHSNHEYMDETKRRDFNRPENAKIAPPAQTFSSYAASVDV